MYDIDRLRCAGVSAEGALVVLKKRLPCVYERFIVRACGSDKFAQVVWERVVVCRGALYRTEVCAVALEYGRVRVVFERRYYPCKVADALSSSDQVLHQERWRSTYSMRGRNTRMTAGRSDLDVDVCCTLLSNGGHRDDNVVTDIILPALINNEGDAVIAIGVE